MTRVTTNALIAQLIAKLEKQLDRQKKAVEQTEAHLELLKKGN